MYSVLTASTKNNAAFQRMGAAFLKYFVATGKRYKYNIKQKRK